MVDWKKKYFYFKIFFWYVFTEPFRLFKELFHDLRRAGKFFDKPSNLLVLVFFLVIISFFLGRLVYIYMTTSFILLAFVHEWRRGYFVKRYREHYKKKINKQL